MRQHPIGTGPFKFVEFKPNEQITLTHNGDYWRLGRPYPDGIEFTIIRDRSTANLAFVAGKLDWIATTLPLSQDITSREPGAICEMTPGGISRNLIVNRDAPPFDNADMRRAVALSLDRNAFIDIISDGQGDIGGVMQSLPEGVWGMPPDILSTLPGYDPDVQKTALKPGRGIVRLTSAERRSPGGIRDHAAATAFLHSSTASARKIRSVARETRWRWRLKVL